MKGNILERNLTDVLYVLNHFDSLIICKHTLGIILARNLFSVLCVLRYFHEEPIY
jgi:D-ribose pyranose/furanose isomerase RbsD